MRSQFFMDIDNSRKKFLNETLREEDAPFRRQVRSNISKLHIAIPHMKFKSLVPCGRSIKPVIPNFERTFRVKWPAIAHDRNFIKIKSALNRFNAWLNSKEEAFENKMVVAMERIFGEEENVVAPDINKKKVFFGIDYGDESDIVNYPSRKENNIQNKNISRVERYFRRLYGHLLIFLTLDDIEFEKEREAKKSDKSGINVSSLKKKLKTAIRKMHHAFHATVMPIIVNLEKFLKSRLQSAMNKFI